MYTNNIQVGKILVDISKNMDLHCHFSGDIPKKVSRIYTPNPTQLVDGATLRSYLHIRRVSIR